MEIVTIDLEFQGKTGVIAAYLIRGEEGNVLIETGPGSTRECLVSKLGELGVSAKDFAAVFVTHVHLDHAGAIGWWTGQGVPVYAHPKAVKHIIDPERLVESARMVYGDAFDRLWGEMTASPKDLVNVIEDGEAITVAGIEVTAIDSPGHAFHHHCYQIGSVIFAGDAVGAKLSHVDYLSVTAAPPQFHLSHTLETLEKIRALKPTAIYPTHFGAVEDVEEHLNSYRDAVELNVQFVRDRLREGMDEDSLRVAYQAFNMEQSFRAGLDSSRWEAYQIINGTDMCADGIRMYWEREANGGA